MQEWCVDDVYDWLTVSWKVEDFGDLAMKLKDDLIDGKGLLDLDEEKLQHYVPIEKKYLIQRFIKTRDAKRSLIAICQHVQDREGMERFARILDEKAESVSSDQDPEYGCHCNKTDIKANDFACNNLPSFTFNTSALNCLHLHG